VNGWQAEAPDAQAALESWLAGLLGVKQSVLADGCGAVPLLEAGNHSRLLSDDFTAQPRVDRYDTVGGYVTSEDVFIQSAANTFKNRRAQLGVENRSLHRLISDWSAHFSKRISCNKEATRSKG